ncbi:MAG: peptidase [Cellvibrionales bacterium]|nr:MAG: peptidase [Cellvibrionales bacterium]
MNGFPLPVSLQGLSVVIKALHDLLSAIQLDEGLVFCSDSRTNAGADRVIPQQGTGSPFRGTLRFAHRRGGNLATSQAVVSQIQRDFEENAEFNISDAKYVSDIAEYIGQLNVAEQDKHRRPGGPDAEGFNASASFILGGQLKGQPSELYLIYPEGNHITASEQHPYLQIGETKYGKPILDRIIQPDTSPEIAMRCGLLSIDSTMRSNATVGPLWSACSIATTASTAFSITANSRRTTPI